MLSSKLYHVKKGAQKNMQTAFIKPLKNVCRIIRLNVKCSYVYYAKSFHFDRKNVIHWIYIIVLKWWSIWFIHSYVTIPCGQLRSIIHLLMTWFLASPEFLGWFSCFLLEPVPGDRYWYFGHGETQFSSSVCYPCASTSRGCYIMASPSGKSCIKMQWQCTLIWGGSHYVEEIHCRIVGNDVESRQGSTFTDLIRIYKYLQQQPQIYLLLRDNRLVLCSVSSFETISHITTWLLKLSSNV